MGHAIHEGQTSASLHLPAEAASVGAARALIRSWSEQNGADAGQANDMTLAVSEAVTNVVLHAYPDGDGGAFDLDARSEPGELVVEVRDNGVGPNVASRKAGLGLGLVVIDRVSHSATVQDSHPGTHVTIRFRLHACDGTPG
jgi:serine/threonine-protein kinase RsbW